MQPRLRMSLILEDTPFRRSYDFVERGLDVVLCFSSLRNASVVEDEIMPLDWVVCASPEYLAHAGTPIAPADLADHACLIHLAVAVHDQIWRFDGPKGPLSVKVNGTFFSNGALALRKAALSAVSVSRCCRATASPTTLPTAIWPFCCPSTVSRSARYLPCIRARPPFRRRCGSSSTFCANGSWCII